MATVIRDGKAIQTTMLNLPSSNIIQQKHKQHHENEIVEEHIKDTEGRIVQKNQWVKGKFLGKGGFAQCFLGTSIPNRTQYALKVVSKDTLVKPSAKQKLQAEIRIHRNLRHSNVVRFDKFFEDEKCAYILLELCKNNSMSELLKRRKRLTEPEVRFYLIQLTSALAYLHDAQIIHRDLKLGNIFLDSNMRVKVGDFGLATKLAYPEERKRTVCGTPNYIAPEILQHHGHSFEVDIWSTGIIIYTLLVGRPPYESKDVEATYARIIANQFSYPPTATVSSEAQHLIQTILQTKPERRPTLLAIENHSFFTTPGAYTPTALTSSAMVEIPIQCLSVPEKKLSSLSSGTSAGMTAGDENDPHALNRNGTTKGSRPLERKLSPRKVTGEQQEEPNRSSAFHARRSASASRTSRLSGEYRPMGTVTTAAASGAGTGAVPSRAGDEKNSSNGNGGMMTRSRKQAVIPLGVKPISSAVTATASGAGATAGVERRGYVRQFEVYNESKPTRATHSNGNGNHNGSSSNQQQLLHLSGDMVPKRSKTCERERRGPSSSSSGSGSSAGVHQKTTATAFRLAAQRYSSLDLQDEETETEAAEENGNGNEETSQRDELNEGGYFANDTADGQVQGGGDMEIVKGEDEGVQEIQHNMERHFQIRSRSLETKHGNGNERAAGGGAGRGGRGDGLLLEDNDNDNADAVVDVDIPRNCRDAWALCDLDDVGVDSAAPTGPSGEGVGLGAGYVTPPSRAHHRGTHGNGNGNGEQGQGQRSEYIYPDTLECMYHTLESSFHPSTVPGTTATLLPPPSSESRQPEVWVVKYVDYTSKYGLGFLLNTNSAGVYFNDSTKIILSPDGTVFQYIERRRRGSTGVIEHLVHTHSIRNGAYPNELIKKVTLLKHFKNYLMEQQTATATQQQQSQPTQQGGEGDVCRDTGESHSNPVWLQSYLDRTVVMQQDTPLLAYVKKWVRTRHAILFRLSNRTVQVVFFDNSEIILSSEARMVTFLNKEGVRSLHRLDTIFTSGRNDVAKRLKYTKDIMARLITMQSSSATGSGPGTGHDRS